jgi:hypothetical protein
MVGNNQSEIGAKTETGKRAHSQSEKAPLSVLRPGRAFWVGFRKKRVQTNMCLVGLIDTRALQRANKIIDSFNRK